MSVGSPKRHDKMRDLLHYIWRAYTVHGGQIATRGGNGYLTDKDDQYLIVTNVTRDFNQKLCLIGLSDDRETLELDPDTLKDIYAALKKRISNTMSILSILDLVANTTRRCFPKSSKEAAKFLSGRLSSAKIIKIKDFIEQGVGYGRHHTLLNCYFLSRLIQDGKLQGEVIYHRQSSKEKGAYTWALFKDTHHKEDTLYLLDSFNSKKVVSLAEPGALEAAFPEMPNVTNSMKEQYRHQQLCNLPTIPEDEEGSSFQQTEEDVSSSKRIMESIKAIKDHIEGGALFDKVGSYCWGLFKGGKRIIVSGKQERVAHRVADIYNLLQQNVSEQSEQCIEKIKALAEAAIQNPRLGRQQATTSFYHYVLTEINKLSTDSPKTPRVARP